MENENKSFGGITPAKVESVDKNFDCIFDDSERVEWLSKDEYHHTEDGLNFDYRYLITANLIDDKDGNDMWYVTLHLVPSPQSLCDEKAESVCECCGIERSELNHSDINDYGCTIDFASDKTSEEDPQQLIDLAGTIAPMVDGLRGFFLDKRINLIGTTGWDVLQNCINGVKIF